MELNLRGKTVLITGGSKGIGKAVAEVFVEEGADVHLVARDAATLAATADELRDGHQANVTTSALDLSDSANIPRLQDAVRRRISWSTTPARSRPAICKRWMRAPGARPGT